jgi:hypothetical protein
MRGIAFVLTVSIALGISACAAPPTCAPDAGPPCECTPGDSRDCTTDAGLSGLQACGMDGRWTACGEFLDGAGASYDVQDDLPEFDFGPHE